MAKGNKKSRGSGNNSTQIISYKGPIKASREKVQITRTLLKSASAISSNSAGFIELYNTTASATSMPEWGQLASIWREYRVLGIRLEWVSVYDKSGSTATAVPGAMAMYHGPPPAWQGAVTTTSIQNTFQMDHGSPWCPNANMVLEWRMDDIDEAQFISTSTSVALGGVYAVSGNSSTSRVMGEQYMTYLIEFKGRV